MQDETVQSERAHAALGRTGSGVLLAVMVLTLACSGKRRPFGEALPSEQVQRESADSGAGGQQLPENVPSEGSNGEGKPLLPGGELNPPRASSDAADLRLAGDGGAPLCPLGATESCGPTSEGVCEFGTRTCVESGWSECEGAIMPGPRDCASSNDNDCDGQPDDVADEVCLCLPGTVEPCSEHLGLDGRGSCRAGARECIAGEGNRSSYWSACAGAIGPASVDSCMALGDDADCDGIPNGGCTCVEGQTVPCGPEADAGICARGTSTCISGSFSQCVGAVFPVRRDCSSPADNDCDGRPDNTIDSTCTCVIDDVQVCGAHPGRDGNGPCQAGRQRCEAGSNNVTSRFGGCSGSVGPANSDSCSALGDDANCDGLRNGGCQCIAGQGNGPCSQDPNAPVCNARGQCVACQVNADCSLVSGGRSFCDRGRCTFPPTCGDGIANGTEACDGGASGSTEIGACNAECTGFYSRKTIRRSVDIYGTNLGGIAGADSICTADFGTGWKALLVGGSRRATLTPFVGDGQQDWVLHKYTYYFNSENEFIWRTDTVALLGASNARQQSLLAPLFDPSSEPGGRYPWSGYRPDWTTINGGTCSGWTSTERSNTGGFITQDLRGFAQEFCDATPYQFILCVEQ